MILKAIGYGALYLTINTVAAVGVVGMTEHGGDVQMARLSHTVETLTVEVADLKQKVEVMGGGRVENDNHNQSAQYVLVQDSTSAAAIEKERQRALLVRDQLAANRERLDGLQ